MNSTLHIAQFAGALALLAGSASGKTGHAVAPEQTLVIRLYGLSEVPAAVLHSATIETNRLFRAAGIQIDWQFRTAETPEDEGTDMTAFTTSPDPDSRPYLVIRFMRRTPPAAFPGALGYSLPFARRGAHVLIFYDRIQALAPTVNTPGYVILGHSMAHELGHVLLRSTDHTRGGLMEARYTPATWRLASAGLVVFDRADLQRLRAGAKKSQLAGQ